MAYKTFVAGEEALAADVNTYLMSQAVPRFANASARASGIAAPVLGQLSVLDTNKGNVDYWNGTAWTPIAGSYERYNVQEYGGSISATVQELTWTSFTMPFAGAIILDGKARIDPYPPQGTTVCNVLIDVGPTSTPAATSTPQWVGPALAATNYYAVIPFSWHWASVPAGTAVTLKIKVATNQAAATLTRIAASTRILPILF